jgi:hypothetical protein
MFRQVRAQDIAKVLDIDILVFKKLSMA